MANRLDAEKLEEIAGFLRTTATEIEAIAARIPRKKQVRRAPKSRDTMTKGMGITIRAFERTHKSWPVDKIGSFFNIDGGRVSEALTPGDKPWSKVKGKP